MGKKKRRGSTFLMMGSTASVLLDEEDAAARPLGRCESGTRIGLCRRMARFFCDLPMGESGGFDGVVPVKSKDKISPR